MRENREIPKLLAADGAAGRIGKARGRTPMMHDSGKSDRPVVPAKPSNNAEPSAAERVEGGGLTKGNTDEQNAPGRSAGQLARQVRSTVYVKEQERTGRRSLGRSCTK
jgi:hypothetical protein